MRELSPAAASGGHSSSRCAGLSPSRPLLSRSTGSRRTGSVVVAHRPSCSAACGIFPDQTSNPGPLPLAGRLSTTAPPGKPINTVFISTQERRNVRQGGEATCPMSHRSGEAGVEHMQSDFQSQTQPLLRKSIRGGFFFFFFLMYLFIFGCVGSSFLCEGFL